MHVVVLCSPCYTMSFWSSWERWWKTKETAASQEAFNTWSLRPFLSKQWFHWERSLVQSESSAGGRTSLPFTQRRQRNLTAPQEGGREADSIHYIDYDHALLCMIKWKPLGGQMYKRKLRTKIMHKMVFIQECLANMCSENVHFTLAYTCFSRASCGRCDKVEV